MKNHGMRLLFLMSIAILAVTLIASCQENGDSSSVVSGYITDSATAAPIDSAIVSWTDTTTSDWFSDSTGAYKIVTWGGGRATVFVRKHGYRTQSRFIEDISSNPTDVDFQLVKE